MEAYEPVFTIRGRNLDNLPEEILLCSAGSKELANSNIDWGDLSTVYTLVVLNRTNEKIQFGRTSSATRSTPLIPYYITTPNNPPRSIIHEFNVNNRSLIIDDEMR